MDTDLPELDGRNVCRQIRKVSAVPILFVSERRSEQEKLCAFELGVDDYLEKPYEPSSADAAPAWEAAARPATRSGISANIKPKRKVAALFKAVPPETASPS